MERDVIYKQHISEAGERITDYLKEVSLEQFTADHMMQAAVVRELEIIGEAAKRLSEEYKAQTSQIPWRKVAGFRDVAVHDYMDIDIDIVWTIVKEDLPEMRKAVAG